MSKELIQNKFYIKREAIILDNRITYCSTLLGTKSQVTIPFEDLTRYKDSYILGRLPILYVSGVAALATFISFVFKDDKDFDPLAWVGWGILFIASALAFLISIEILWKVKVQNNTYLFFFKALPNKTEVDNFITEMFVARDAYLRETYFFEPTKNVSYEIQIGNLQWLRKNQAISREEFIEGKKNLDELFNAKKIGYN